MQGKENWVKIVYVGRRGTALSYLKISIMLVYNTSIYTLSFLPVKKFYFENTSDWDYHNLFTILKIEVEINKGPENHKSGQSFMTDIQ